MWMSGLLVVLASACVGAFVGWLVGSSSTPVVAVLIPLAFGLTGVLWDRYATLKSRVDTAAAAAASGDNARAAEVVRATSATADRSRSHATISAAVIAFVLGAFAGTHFGIETRIPRLPPLSELVGGDTTLTYREAALLAKLRMDLGALNVGVGEAREVFSSAVVPVLRNPQYQPGGALHDVRFDALRAIRQELMPTNIEAQPRTGRGPASIPPATDTT